MTTVRSLAAAHPQPARPGLRKTVQLLGQALLARRQRSRLAELDAHLLADIGVTPDMAADEAGRSFWDVPGHWKR